MAVTPLSPVVARFVIVPRNFPLERTMNPLRMLDRWAVGSQQQARRNAMIASTALAQRRAELTEVEDYLSAMAGPAPLAPTVQEEAATAAHG